MSAHLKHANVTEIILGGFYDVFNVLGSGFVEGVYIAAMVIVLRSRGLQVEEKPSLPVYFNDQILGRFTPDLLLNGVVIVEAKAVRAIEAAHKAQVINYLKASNVEVGLLLNFGDTPQFQRFVFDNERKADRKPPQELGGSDPSTADLPGSLV
jgi:GxxExxY protein